MKCDYCGKKAKINMCFIRHNGEVVQICTCREHLVSGRIKLEMESTNDIIIEIGRSFDNRRVKMLNEIYNFNF